MSDNGKVDIPPACSVSISGEGRGRRISIGLKLTLPVNSPFTQYHTISPSISLSENIGDESLISAFMRLYSELTAPYMMVVLEELKRSMRMGTDGIENAALELFKVAIGNKDGK